MTKHKQDDGEYSMTDTIERLMEHRKELAEFVRGKTVSHLVFSNNISNDFDICFDDGSCVEFYLFRDDETNAYSLLWVLVKENGD